MLNIIKNTINRVFASGVDSDASAFITATGLSGTTQKSAITTLVKDLKSSGLWSKMKAVYPMVTDNVNILSYSEDYTNGVWVKSSTSVVQNTVIAPNGTLTGDTINLLVSANHRLNQVVTVSPNTTYTFSFYVKRGTATALSYSAYDATNGGNIVAPTNYYSQTSSTNWTKVSFSFTTPNLCTSIWVYPLRDSNSTGDLYLWGSQLELGSVATNYQQIATTPSAFMASQMKYNLKDARDLDAAFRLTWSGGWTYSATGATPNGTNAYADTRFNLLTNLPGYDNSFSVYFRQNLYGVYKVGASGTSFDRGMSAHLGWTNSSGTLYHDNLGRNTMTNSAYGTFDAYHISSVTSTSSQKLYRNGVMKLSGAATAGLTQPSINFYFGASNDNGTANYFDPKQIAFGTLSTSLTDQDAQLLNQIVEKYQVALSRGVQAAQSFYYNSAYSNEANTYLYSTQITGTTQVSAINTLINGLKANNLWTKMKAVYPFVTDYINLLIYTEDFTNVNWYTSGLQSRTANTTIAPNGTLTADTVTDNTTNAAHELAANYTIVGGINGDNTFSVYMKANTLNWGCIGIYTGAVFYKTFFDLQNGVIGNSDAGNTATIENAGNGWYRCSVKRNFNALASFNVVIHTAISNGVDVYAGTNQSLYLWGAQLQAGSLTAYQPVLGANNYAANVAAQMKFNLVNPQDTDAAFRLAFSGGWTYSTNGAQPNGTNGYADTKLGQTAAGMFTNSHLSFYSRTNSTTATSQVEMGVGATLGGTFTNLLMRLDTVTNYVGGSIGSRNALSTATNSTGHLLVNALSASAKAYKNGSLVATDTSTQTGALNTIPIYIGCQNNNSVPGAYTTRQAAFASIGDGLSDACLLYTSPSPRDYAASRMPSSA